VEANSKGKFVCPHCTREFPSAAAIGIHTKFKHPEHFQYRPGYLSRKQLADGVRAPKRRANGQGRASNGTVRVKRKYTRRAVAQQTPDQSNGKLDSLLNEFQHCPKCGTNLKAFLTAATLVLG